MTATTKAAGETAGASSVKDIDANIAHEPGAILRLPFGAWFNVYSATFISGSGFVFGRRATAGGNPFVRTTTSLGCLLLTSSYIIASNDGAKNHGAITGGHLLASTTGVLGFTLGARQFLRTGHILPAGVVCLASSLTIGYNQWKAILENGKVEYEE